MFMEPQQRFTLRKDKLTIATGIITELLPRRTEGEKDKRYVKMLIRSEMGNIFCLPSS